MAMDIAEEAAEAEFKTAMDIARWPSPGAQRNPRVVKMTTQAAGGNGTARVEAASQPTPEGRRRKPNCSLAALQ